LPAFELARALREGEISAVELLECFLDRVRRFNPELNAIVALDETGARQRAREADEASARGESWGPLHGVPMTVKESFDVKGLPTTWGVPAFRDMIAESNASAVDAMLNAGAIVFGKTNVPYMLADWQTFNSIHGTTNNPWDRTRAPGGSSGGAAAALASGMTALELGSDIGSSIRNPAHFCGVFGHKPSFGLVPQTGHGVPGAEAPMDMQVCGPLARSAEDLALALTALARPEAGEISAWRLRLPQPKQNGLQDFRAAAMLDSPLCAVDDSVVSRLNSALDTIEKAGGHVDRSSRPEFAMQESHELFLQVLRGAVGAILNHKDYEAIADDAARLPEQDRSYRAQAARATVQTYRQWYRGQVARRRLRQSWARFFESFDVLLCPVAAVAAFPHDQDIPRHARVIRVNGRDESYNDQLFWAGLASLSYLPSTVVPAGRTAQGLPVGLQIIGPYLQDLSTIEYGRLVSSLLGGFAAPTAYADR